jgi:hypothetical protein
MQVPLAQLGTFYATGKINQFGLMLLINKIHVSGKKIPQTRYVAVRLNELF